MKNSYVIEYTPTFFGNLELTFQLCNENQKATGKSFFLYKPEAGNIVLVNIYFDTGKYNIKEIYDSEIERLAAVMRSNPNLIVEIRGHTDDQGS
jgi:outer membrane protein OmpA-like peptidoglycan-associated protein